MFAAVDKSSPPNLGSDQISIDANRRMVIRRAQVEEGKNTAMVESTGNRREIGIDVRRLEPFRISAEEEEENEFPFQFIRFLKKKNFTKMNGLYRQRKDQDV